MLKGILLYIKTNPSLNDFLLQMKLTGCPVSIEKTEENISSVCISSAADRIGILPEECLLITDSDSVAYAAQSAHIPCLGYLSPEQETNRLSSCYSLFESFDSIDMAYLRRVHAHACSYPAPILTTPRLVIREFAIDDFPVLYEMCASTEESSYLKHPLERYETEQKKHEAYIKNFYPFFDLALWGLYDKQSGELIGHAGFSLTDNETAPFAIGYFIAPPYRKQGYATECVPHLLSYAKEQGYSVIPAKINKNNTASQKVIQHCGYPYDVSPNKENNTLFYTIYLEQ